MTTDTKQQYKSVGKALGVVLAGAGLVGTVSYVALLPQPTGPTKTFEAVYAEQDKWEIPESVYEWSYKTNLTGSWLHYRTIEGTNTLTVSLREFQQGFFTITKIMRKGFTNVYITRQNGGI